MHTPSNGVYAPLLRVREIPFDLRRAVALDDPRAMLDDFGKATVLDFVALNLVAEFGETVLFYLNRKHGVMATGDESRSFVHQELRHAAALHKVNKRFIGEDYVHTDFGRISRICHSARAPVLMNLLAARDPTRQPDVLEQMSLELAAFETTYGLLAQVPQFELLAQDPAPFLRHPAFSYVMPYHAAEEAEHTHVSWQHHQRTYGVDIFDAQQRDALLNATGRVLDDITRVTFLVADAMQVKISEQEVEDVFVTKGRRQFMDRLRSGDFHPSQYSSLRSRCVQAWDDEWEPKLRHAVEHRLNR